MDYKVSPDVYSQLLALPLEIKIKKSRLAVERFLSHYNYDCYISFSGGIDSTVLLHLVRSVYPGCPGVFSDTGLEFTLIKEFVKRFDNVSVVRPSLTFPKVISQFGYPVIDKRVSGLIADKRFDKVPEKWSHCINAPFKISNKCCQYLKHEPLEKLNKPFFVGTMGSDSFTRRMGYMKVGCNNFNLAKSTPLGFWTRDDIYNYVRRLS